MIQSNVREASTYETIEFKRGHARHATSSTRKTENAYERNPTTRPTVDTVQEYVNVTLPSTEALKPSSKNQRLSHVIILLVCVVVFLAALGLIFEIFNFTRDQKLAKSPLGTYLNPARSCVELRDAGLKDGIYVIQPSLTPFKAYCGMVAAGGGWILAATINDNNFNRTEAYGGSWFLTTSNNQDNVLNYQNWMNTNIFGTIDDCLKSDFKSQVYFEYQGKDIMLRYVPNRTPLVVSREQSFLQYQTDNGFMENYGGNLRNIFNYHYPLKPTHAFFPDVNLTLDRLAAKSTEITNLITDFYLYDYGSSSYQLCCISLYCSLEE